MYTARRALVRTRHYYVYYEEGVSRDRALSCMLQVGCYLGSRYTARRVLVEQSIIMYTARRVLLGTHYHVCCKEGVIRDQA